MKNNFDLNRTPLVVIWEVTRACDLACFHCRASAQPQRNPLELSTVEAKKLIDDVAQLDPPIFIFTGGDPLKRPDIYELVEHAASKYLHPAMTPSATPLLNPESLMRLKRAGLRRLALSLDGPTPELHDFFRGVPGSFARTLDAMYWANAIGLPVQINTTVSRRNIAELENVLSVIRNFRIVMWSLFFMVPTGRAEAADLPSAEEFESAFAKIYRLAQNVPFKVKTTEAQHYRRYLLQQRPRANREGYLQTACQEYCRSMRARVSCSFPTPVRCNPAVFFLSLRATYDRPMSATSTAIPNCFDSCATPTIYWASVETASSVTCAAGRELALMPSAEMPLPKTRAVHIFPGSEGQTARVQMHQ